MYIIFNGWKIIMVAIVSYGKHYYITIIKVGRIIQRCDSNI